MADATPLPIACTLEDVEAGERMQAWRRLADSALLASERSADGVRLVFRSNPAAERSLLELVEAERRCCPFLDLRLVRAPDAVALEVSGPTVAGSVVELVAEMGASPD
jgi:hypothetical protein